MITNPTTWSSPIITCYRPKIKQKMRKTVLIFTLIANIWYAAARLEYVRKLVNAEMCKLQEPSLDPRPEKELSPVCHCTRQCEISVKTSFPARSQLWIMNYEKFDAANTSLWRGYEGLQARVKKSWSPWVGGETGWRILSIKYRFEKRIQCKKILNIIRFKRGGHKCLVNSVFWSKNWCWALTQMTRR